MRQNLMPSVLIVMPRLKRRQRAGGPIQTMMAQGPTNMYPLVPLRKDIE